MCRCMARRFQDKWLAVADHCVAPDNRASVLRFDAGERLVTRAHVEPPRELAQLPFRQHREQ